MFCGGEEAAVLRDLLLGSGWGPSGLPCVYEELTGMQSRGTFWKGKHTSPCSPGGDPLGPGASDQLCCWREDRGSVRVGDTWPVLAWQHTHACWVACPTSRLLRADSPGGLSTRAAASPPDQPDAWPEPGGLGSLCSGSVTPAPRGPLSAVRGQ